MTADELSFSIRLGFNQMNEAEITVRRLNQAVDCI